MIERLHFAVEWLHSDRGGGPEAATFGSLRVTSDDEPLTRALDVIAQTSRDSIRVSLHPLAAWFADNWWRLRWEPAHIGGPNPSWRMAHDVAAAGGGYVWPAMRFTSDGETVRIETKPTREAHTVQYLDRFDAVCGAGSFMRAVDALLDQVLAREHGLGCVDRALEETWKAVRDERNDPASSRFRRHEAMLGLSPDEVDGDQLEKALAKGEWMGPDGALDEILAGRSLGEMERAIEELGALRRRAAPRLSLDEVRRATSAWSPSEIEPWQKGTSLARHLRRRWQLGDGPVTDEFLSDLLGQDIHSEQLCGPEGAPAVAFREHDSLSPALIPSRRRTSRRLAIARLISDAVIAAPSDVVLPLTRSFTARQKLQRAAAQELLCPVDALVERVTLPMPDEDEIAEAAEHFQVSRMLVSTTLVNKKLAPRSLLGSFE